MNDSIALIDKNRCYGCAACAQKCPQQVITMERDATGFLFPVIDQKHCVHCGLCLSVCPANVDIIQECKPTVYGGYAKNQKIRYESSSGGVFTILSESVIDMGGTVYGVAYGKSIRHIGHIPVQDKSELKRLRGSKYVQSDIGTTYSSVQKDLRSNIPVLFSGTACQIAGLKSFLGREYDNLLCVDVICHGVPSPLMWEKYLDSVEQKYHSEIINFEFRSKRYSWKDFGIKKQLGESKEKFEFAFENSYFRFFNSNLCLRPTCYDCKFKGIRNLSDISLGDFWNVNKIISDQDDGKGLSIILINTDHGKRFFESIKDNLILIDRDITYEEACKCNRAISDSMKTSPQRSEFFRDLTSMKYDAVVKKYAPLAKKHKLKSIILRAGLPKYWKILGGDNLYGFEIVMQKR